MNEVLMRLVALLAAAMLALAPASSFAKRRAPVTVFAAASLTNALEDVGRIYTARSRQPVRFSFASSSVIARQLEGGARADLFVSADRQWMDYVEARGLIANATRRDILRGRLALIAPRAGNLRLAIRPGFPLAAALGPRGRLAIGDPAYVPAGRYAHAALRRLGVWDAVAGRLVRAENVRVALAYVARGEAPLGIVYETDAKIEPGVHIVGLFPAASHKPIVYPAAITSAAAPGARAFYEFMRGPTGAAIFRRHGFGVVADPSR